jgi:hypothetical protein
MEKDFKINFGLACRDLCGWVLLGIWNSVEKRLRAVVNVFRAGGGPQVYGLNFTLGTP